MCKSIFLFNYLKIKIVKKAYINQISSLYNIYNPINLTNKYKDITQNHPHNIK